MIKAIMIGSGARGIGAYGAYALIHPDEISFIAVADPDLVRRGYFASMHGIELSMQFQDAQAILSHPKMADACFICTQDHHHVEPALQAMKLGYHVFLEKPMAVHPLECIQLGRASIQHNVHFMIGHVLRYTSFFQTIKRLLDEGSIGDLMTIQHNENVSFWHHAHSYVRGNWRNEAISSPMILAKSCHDLDLLIWFIGSHPKHISSFGELTYFTSSSAPSGAPMFCMEGCPMEGTCPYFAPLVYTNAPDWMRLAVSNDLSNESMLTSLYKGPYGRCVFHSDNDVVDHQVLILDFPKGVTASFTMTAFTHENTRTIKLMGSTGEIRGHMEKGIVELYQFGRDEVISIQTNQGSSGHGGGDEGIMTAFIELLNQEPTSGIDQVNGAISAHLTAFAAEVSRHEKKIVLYEDYMKQVMDSERTDL